MSLRAAAGLKSSSQPHPAPPPKECLMLKSISKILTTAALGAALHAAGAAAAVLPDEPRTDGTVTCHPTETSGPYRFSTLTVNYHLTPIERFGDDLHATVDGTFELDAC